MAFTIDFATSSASQKVEGLTKQVGELTQAANTASQALENSFKRGAVAKTTAESIKPISKQIASLSSNLKGLDITPLQALYSTLKTPVQSTKELQDLSNSVFKLSRTLPQIDERNLEALFSVLKNKPHSVGELNSLAGSFTAIGKALPTIQPTPIRKLFNAMEKYKPIGADFEKLGKGFEAIGKAIPTINAQPVVALFNALGSYKPIGGDLSKIGTGLGNIAKHIPELDVARVSALMTALNRAKFDGSQIKTAAQGIEKISKVAGGIDSKPLSRLFQVIRNYPKVTIQINQLAEALRNLSKAQSAANTQAMKKVVGNAMGGLSSAAQLAGFSQEQIKMIQSVGDKIRGLAEGKKRVAATKIESSGTLTWLGKFNNHLKIADQSSAALRASMNALGTHMGIFTGRTIAVATAVYTTISAFKAMITTGSSFTKEMIRATSIIGATQEESVMLEDKVRSLARTTIFTGTQVAQGLTYLAMAGLNTNEAIAALEPTLNIAKIGSIEFSEAADITTNVLRAFKLNAEDLSGVADDLATAITASNATIQQMAKALSYVAPIAYAAGGSIREVTSLLAVMHDVGIKSSRAGTALRRAYGNLLAPTEKVSKTLRKLGVQTYDANGRLRSMVGIFVDLADKGATSADVMNLFGVRASSALQSLLDDINSVNPKLRNMMEILGDNEGSAARLGAAFEDYLGGDALKLVSALQEKFLEIFKVNEKGFRKLTKDLTEFVNTLDAKRIGEWIDGMVELVKYMWKFREAISYTGAVILASPLVVIFGAAMAKLVGWLTSAALWLGRIALFSTPLTALVTSLAALGYVAYDYWSKMQEVQQGAIDLQKEVNEGVDEEIKKREEAFKKFDKKPLPDKWKPLGETAYLFSHPEKKDYQQDNSTRDRMDTLYAGQTKQLNELEAHAVSVGNALHKQIAIFEKAGLDTKIFDPAIAKLKSQLAAVTEHLIGIKEARKLLQDQLGDANKDNGFLPEDITKRNEFASEIEKASTSKDYDNRASRIKAQSERQIKDLEHLQKTGAMTEKATLNAIKSVENSKYGQLISDKVEQLGKVQKELEKIKKDLNIGEDGKIPNMPEKSADGRSVADTRSLGGSEDYIEKLKEVRDAEQELYDLRHEANMRRTELDQGYIQDLIKDAGFEDATEKLKNYNEEVDITIAKIKAETEALKTGIEPKEALLTLTEQKTMADWDNLISKQKLAIAAAIEAKEDKKVVDQLQKKYDLIVALRKELGGKYDKLSSARQENQDQEEYEKEIERLKRLRFLPREQRTIEEYDDNLADLKKYYTEVKGYEEDRLEEYDDYLQARLALDWEYFEAAHPIYEELFTSISDEMKSAITDAVVYGSTWEEVAGRVRNALFEGVVNALVQEGIEMAKVGLMKILMSQREVAAEQAVTAVKVAGKATETGAEVAKIATVSAAEKTASASASSSVAGLIGQGAEVAAAWSAAAVNVSTATFGAAALAGSAALTTAQALNMALSLAMSAAGAVASGGAGAVKGRKFGGHVSAGEPVLVGEERAEVFVPDRAGTIITERQNKQKGSPFGGGEGSGTSQAMPEFKIINAIDPEFIKDYLASSEGEQIVINHIQKNRGSF